MIFMILPMLLSLSIPTSLIQSSVCPSFTLAPLFWVIARYGYYFMYHIRGLEFRENEWDIYHLNDIPYLSPRHFMVTVIVSFCVEMLTIFTRCWIFHYEWVDWDTIYAWRDFVLVIPTISSHWIHVCVIFQNIEWKSLTHWHVLLFDAVSVCLIFNSRFPIM